MRKLRRPGLPRLLLPAMLLALILAAAFVLAAPRASAAPSAGDQGLAAFSDVTGEWGNGVEAVIEKAYRECFRTFVIDGNILTLRLPFAENSERSELTETELAVVGGGKASPTELWDAIGGILASPDFSTYLGALSDGREKLVSFDLPTKTWSTSTDRFAIERMLSGLYPGLPYRPVVHVTGQGAEPSDVYNYLYCVGRLGIDCSGFVWHVLKAIAAADRVDLDRLLGRDAGLPKGRKPSLYVGTWYYDPKSGRTRAVNDEIANLLPGDILLFRGEDGSFLHSCVIQSIDLARGRIRYLQSTDESPLDERGVHESIILFDPAKPKTSLKDPSLRWLQLRGATFPGEPEPAFLDDGERFRAYQAIGGSIVVRFKALEKSVAKLGTMASPAPGSPGK